MEAINLLASALSTWEWWAIGGIALLVAEIFLPGAFLLWPGLAALVVSILAFLVEPSWKLNLIMFAGLSFVSAYFWRNTYMGRQKASDQPALNQRSRQLVGRTCVLATDTNDAGGRVLVGDTSWTARTAPGVGMLRAGTRVRVVHVEGTVLIVTPEAST